MEPSPNLGKTLQQLKDKTEAAIVEAFNDLARHNREAYIYNSDFRERRQWKLNNLVAAMDELVALRRFE